MNENHYNQVILDSHVHYYNSWNISLDQLFSTIHYNLSTNIHRQVDNKILTAVCLLDTDKCVNPIAELLYQLHLNQTSTWKLIPLEKEPFAFWASNEDKMLLIITGTQYVTREGLEVLKIGQSQPLNHGNSILHMLEINDQSSLTILPWAVGKWLGKRGDLVSHLLENVGQYNFLLGDNGGRPKIWNNIKQFKYASKIEMPIIAGSDPLPVKNQYLKAGSYGNFLKLELDYRKPWESIIYAIHHQKIETFGKLSSLSSFISNQLKLRL